MSRFSIPSIHLNGSSQQSLLDSVCSAGEAVSAAINALYDMAPNARDYYPQGPTAYPTARADHDARIAKLQDVRRELEALAESIADGGFHHA